MKALKTNEAANSVDQIVVVSNINHTNFELFHEIIGAHGYKGFGEMEDDVTYHLKPMNIEEEGTYFVSLRHDLQSCGFTVEFLS